MNELSLVGRNVSRATAANAERPLNFLGSDGGSASDRPTVFAKVAIGEAPKKVLKQAAAPAVTPPVPAGHAPLSIDEAKTLRDAIVSAQPGAEFIFKSKGCPGLTQDSFVKLASLKSRLDNFISKAQAGNTFPVSADDLDLMDKVIACAIRAQKVPDTWAYVIFGAAVAGVVVAMNV